MSLRVGKGFGEGFANNTNYNFFHGGLQPLTEIDFLINTIKKAKEVHFAVVLNVEFHFCCVTKYALSCLELYLHKIFSFNLLLYF